MTETAAETATETTTTETTTETATETGAEDLAKEVEKWKTLSKQNEARAKANADAAKRLQELERQNMSEMEAAIDKARTETRAEVSSQFGSKLATEALRAAAAGRVADVDALLEGIDASKFLGEDGDPDRDAITAWVDRIAPKADEDATQVATFLDLGQGARTATTTTADPLQKALEGISRRAG